MFKKILFIVIHILLIVFGSCENQNILEQAVNNLKSEPIVLCLDSMEMYTFDKKTNVNVDSINFSSKYNLIVYYDSTSCSTCAVKGLYSWFEVLDTLTQRYDRNVKTIFIFSPKDEDLLYLRKELKTALFD